MNKVGDKIMPWRLKFLAWYTRRIVRDNYEHIIEIAFVTIQEPGLSSDPDIIRPQGPEVSVYSYPYTEFGDALVKNLKFKDEAVK